MSNFSDLVLLLRRALEQPEQLEALVRQFQNLVWDNTSDDLGLDVLQSQVLRELALDLSYFVADPRNRAEDPSYFGPERAVTEIEEALERLGHSRTN
jgi:hypothetical protein